MKAIILSAAADTGGVGAALARALNRHTGVTARAVCRSLNYIEYPHDLLWPIGDPMPEAVAAAYRDADVVHVMEAWDAVRPFDGWRDRPLVLHHHGSILRANHDVLTRGAAEFRAVRLVSTPDLLLYDPGAEWLPNPVDVNAMRDMRMDAQRPERFTVFHSPTNRRNKGTDAFLAAAAQAGVAVDLAERVPWSEALARKAGADAVFDQLGLGYGLAGAEAMAMRIPVVSGASDPEGIVRGSGVPGGTRLVDHLAALWGCLPFYNATPDTLADRLREVATDAELRERLADAGQYHACRWHDEFRVAQQLVEVYERAIEAKR